MKRPNRRRVRTIDFANFTKDGGALELALALLAGEAEHVGHELAPDLVAIDQHVRDELAEFHRQFDASRPAAPAWRVKGGVA